MRVYQFQKAEIGLKILRENRLKISKLDNLNDPFEFIGFANKDTNIRNSILRTRDQMAQNSGLLCFSRRWNNPVQWSHYADQHRGLCLGFDVTSPEMMLKVEYTRKRPEFIIEDFAGDTERSQASMRKLLTTKFCHWRYEDEVRCFTTLKDKYKDDHYYVDLHPSFALREVIIGTKSTVTSDQIRSAFKGGTQPKIITARLSFQSFKVVSQQQKNLQK